MPWFWLLVGWIEPLVLQEEEVGRVREVLEPVVEARLGVELAVTDGREVRLRRR